MYLSHNKFVLDVTIFVFFYSHVVIYFYFYINFIFGDRFSEIIRLMRLHLRCCWI